MKFGCSETSCTNCGACCKGWDIELSKEDIRTIAKKGYDIEAVRMGGEYLLEKGEKGKAYHLRIRQEQPAIFCEVSLDGKDWKIVKEIVLNKEMPDPELVRLGKASDNGGTGDTCFP